MEGLELYINENYIELSEDSRIGITFVSNEIGSVQNKRANFTNQFKVPKTGANLIALGYPNEINSQSTLPYTKLDCRVVQDGVEIITNGYAIINDSDEFISLTAYSGNADFFEAIKGLKLTDIDLSAYNHTWNLANIADNIDNQTNEECYVYGLVAYGESLPSGASVRTKYLPPCIRATILLEKIVSNSGFNISGAIYDDSESILHKMVLPYSRNEGQQEAAIYTQQLFSVGLLAAGATVNIPTFSSLFTYYPYGIGGNIPFDDEGTPFFDNGGLHLGGKYVAALDMFQVFTATASIDVMVNIPAAASYATGSISLAVQIVSKNAVTGVTSIIASNVFTTYTIPIVAPTTYNVSVTSASSLVNTGDVISVNIKVVSEIAYQDISYQTVAADGDMDITVNDTCTFLNSTDGNIVYGEALIISALLPDMLQSDFIKNILQMTCGQIQTNSYNSTIYLSSFQEVAENVTIKDWSEKYNDVTDKIKFHSSYSQNNYLKYKSDSSNEVTPGVPNEIGNGVIIINDEALTKDATIIQLQFAGTPSTPTERHIGSSVYKVLPLVNKVDPTTFSFTLKTEPRILLYERETYASDVRYLGDVVVDGFPNDEFITTNYTTWFIDTVTDREFQLGFNNNLIQTYFQTLIGMLTNYKEVEVEIDLTVADLNNYFDHSIPVYIEKYQEKFYVSSVNNFQKGKLTKCNLIRL